MNDPIPEPDEWPPGAIKRARLNAGITQEHLARSIRVTKTAVANWEQGLRVPGLWYRAQLDRVLGEYRQDQPMP